MAIVRDRSGNNHHLDTHIPSGREQSIILSDGITAPDATSGLAKLYVDGADGDLKVKFGDGTTKVVAADT